VIIYITVSANLLGLTSIYDSGRSPLVLASYDILLAITRSSNFLSVFSSAIGLYTFGSV